MCGHGQVYVCMQCGVMSEARLDLPVELLGLLCNEEFRAFLFCLSFIVSTVHHDVRSHGWRVKAGEMNDG